MGRRRATARSHPPEAARNSIRGSLPGYPLERAPRPARRRSSHRGGQTVACSIIRFSTSSARAAPGGSRRAPRLPRSGSISPRSDNTGPDLPPRAFATSIAGDRASRKEGPRKREAGCSCAPRSWHQRPPGWEPGFSVRHVVLAPPACGSGATKNTSRFPRPPRRDFPGASLTPFHRCTGSTRTAHGGRRRPPAPPAPPTISVPGGCGFRIASKGTGPGNRNGRRSGITTPTVPFRMPSAGSGTSPGRPSPSRKAAWKRVSTSQATYPPACRSHGFPGTRLIFVKRGSSPPPCPVWLS